jgi:HPt (histidine-containing phosphotransfer) domain-containing protein
MSRWVHQASIQKALQENFEFFCETEQIFRELYPALERRFDDAFQADNFSEIREAAHILKTRLRYLHCYTLGDSADALEKMAVLEQWTEVRTAHAQLRRDIDEALEELRLIIKEYRE